MTAKRDPAPFDNRKGIKIKPFSVGDLPRVMEIERRAFPDAWDESWFLYFYQTNPSGFMVAVDGKNNVIGYAIVNVESDAEDAWFFMEGRRLPPQRGHLLNIAVDEDRRSQGVGSILLKAADDYVSGMGVNEIFLEVQTTNSNARRFYANRGYKETGKILRDYYPRGGDAVIMKKRLGKSRRSESETRGNAS
ncbi:MAG: ribosomal protein S18-alanine N-acetyltransferase [Promethearchaeati archaeon SRVP18_Atabeyarchaeia-1]